MQDRLEILALGGLTIKHNGTLLVGFASRKVPALLLYLACHNRPLAREVLAELLWQERSQERSLSNLRVVLSSLREHLEPFLDISRQTVGLNPQMNIQLDVIDFEAQIAAARGQWKQLGRLSRPVVQQLAKAVKLYEGDFLAGFYVRDGGGFDEWASVERERLRRIMIEVLNDLTNYYLELEGEAYTDGRNPRYVGIEYANRSLQFDPLREETYRQLMHLHARLGLRSEALAQYENCRQIFKRELGVDPSPETMALHKEIQSGQYKAQQREAASLKTKQITYEPSPLDWKSESPSPDTQPRRDENPPEEEAAEKKPRLRVCRYCQYEVPEDALVCDNCGKGAKTTVSLGYAEPEEGDITFDDDTVLLMHFFGVREPVRVFVPEAKDIILGRSPTAEIDLSPYNALEAGVSRVHVIIRRQGNTLVASDMDSSNGSYINGQRLYAHEIRVLRHGDELRMGKLVSRIRFYRP